MSAADLTWSYANVLVALKNRQQASSALLENMRNIRRGQTDEDFEHFKKQIHEHLE